MTTDYTRINKSINFDQLNAKMHEAEHKDAKQLRVKHDWKTDGKVQMASKLKSEGKHPGWSGRNNKIANGKQFVLDAFKRSTGVDASQTIKNMVNTDQTSVQGGGKTIGEMLGDVRDQWHKDVSKKYGSGPGLNGVINEQTLTNDETSRVNGNKPLVKSLIQWEIGQAPLKSGGKIVSDADAKQIAANVIKRFLAHSKSPQQLQQLTNDWNKQLAQDFSSGTGFDKLVADRGSDLEPHQKSLLNEFKQVGSMQHDVVNGNAGVGDAIKMSGDRPLSLENAKYKAQLQVDKYVALAKVPPQLASKMSGALADMKNANSQEDAALIAKQLIADVNSYDGTPDELETTEKNVLSRLIATSLTSRADGGHEACREVGDLLLKIELKQSNGL